MATILIAEDDVGDSESVGIHRDVYCVSGGATSEVSIKDNATFKSCRHVCGNKLNKVDLSSKKV